MSMTFLIMLLCVREIPGHGHFSCSKILYMVNQVAHLSEKPVGHFLYRFIVMLFSCGMTQASSVHWRKLSAHRTDRPVYNLMEEIHARYYGIRHPGLPENTC